MTVNRRYITRRTDVYGKKPTPDDLQVGELGINTADGTLFTKNIEGHIIMLNRHQDVPRCRTWSIGDGIRSSFHLWHLLDTLQVTVTVSMTVAPYSEVYPDVQKLDSNNVIVSFTNYIPTLNEFYATVRA